MSFQKSQKQYCILRLRFHDVMSGHKKRINFHLFPVFNEILRDEGILFMNLSSIERQNNTILSFSGNDEYQR